MKLPFQEQLIQFIWQFQRFDNKALYTILGEKLEIIHPGSLNDQQGPDFSHACVIINGQKWFGNIEIHLRSSDWYKHKHNKDDAYNSSVLHVVYESDVPVINTKGIEIPCLELKNRISKTILERSQYLMENQLWIPCQGQIHSISKIKTEFWLEYLSVERLQEKSEQISLELEKTKMDWELSFYRTLMKYFGFKRNETGFTALGNAIPLNLILKYGNKLSTIEALLFGQAGLLEDPGVDEYYVYLQQEYQHLKIKHRLINLPKHIWKFGRLRPPNFPTIRIAQLAVLFSNQKQLFQKVLGVDSIEDWKKILSVKTSEYWETHYLFDKKSAYREKKVGLNSMKSIFINVFVPFVFSWGKITNNHHFSEKALNLQSKIKPEQNSIINDWKKLGFSIGSASESQALLQLKNNYCDKKRCLDCRIGRDIICAST